MQHQWDILGIGNAIVDVLACVDDNVIDRLGIRKASMRLIDEPESESLYQNLPSSKTEVSGGSVANTVTAISSLGGRSAFIGVVHDDSLGHQFHNDITAHGVFSRTIMRHHGPKTARSIIMVTPDGERTMNTFLGACADLRPGDIDPLLIQASDIIYLEGYLFDPPHAREALFLAAKYACDAGKRVALTLSDPACVDRHREDFLHIIKNHVDILFANEAEACALYAVNSLPEIYPLLAADVPLAAVTRSALGSLVITPDTIHQVSAHHPPAIIDTTGAGDTYAAGFLFALQKRLPLPQCASIGGLCAAEIISLIGARPQRPLSTLLSSSDIDSDPAP